MAVMRPRRTPLLSIVLMVLVVGGLLMMFINPQSNVKDYSYTELETELLNKDNVVTELQYHYRSANLPVLYGKFKNKDGKEIEFKTVIRDEDFDWIQMKIQVEKPNDTFNVTYVEQAGQNIFISIIMNILPFALMIIVVLWLMSRSGAGKSMDFGKNKARLQQGSTVKFNDVAGATEEKEELVEMVDFLRSPIKYAQAGARVPKGVLLVGPPGTGKTLLAKAVAGEANVPFFSISGSDFVEMFVGVGASRVRNMFKEAKMQAPCIIFIDEIDAVGRQRGAGLGGGNDEREQTLNQLLVEMDGFSENQGIIVIAATNRDDVLDQALLRPGRFDRRIMVSLPDVKARKEILGVHARNKQLASSVDLNNIARRTPGFSGAQLENVLNEAALLSVRENKSVITTESIDEAIDRVIGGPAKKSRKTTEDERKLIAYHEAGHAVIGLKLEDSQIVQKVTIIPRGDAGGYVLMTPKEEKMLQTKKQLITKITSYMAGRCSEEIHFGKDNITTGAYSDIQEATNIARRMVTEFGMSSLGPIQYESQRGSVFLGRDYADTSKNFSSAVAKEIDDEVRKIIDGAYKNAMDILMANKDLIKSIAEALLENETLTAEQIEQIEKFGHIQVVEEAVPTPKVIVENNFEEENTQTDFGRHNSFDDIEFDGDEELESHENENEEDGE